ncbi:ArsR/SmtB family transcription factor [Pseudonocardia endophytica]|uniref:ArsR/SmtB family transcription factor n=1 Tax=Pseudonocardia endophytica TaxID=401976 RepID=UPI00104891BC|nr:DUF5937 family protein [Pseudonocardia endophytica]
MATELDLDVTELARTRFGVSPLSETVAALQLLGGRARPEASLRWVRWAVDELARQPLDLHRTWPLIVNDRSSWPQFLVPAPHDAATTLDEDLATVRRTTADQVRASLCRVFGDDLPDSAAQLAARPAEGLHAIAAELRRAHDRLVAPHWSRIRAVLDADVAYRARQLASGGLERLLADLHPELGFADGRLVLRTASRDREVNRVPGGLVLMPVVLGSQHVLIKGNSTTRTTVRYPARGVGALWTAGTRPAPGRVVRLLGRPRAELLEALQTPATTADLAAAFGVSASAVSQHLRVLRENGLVASERTGRAVLHLTTARGQDLLL